VLVEPRNPLNIGAVARAMSNFGFTGLFLVNPYEAAFREARSAVRAHYILEQAQVCGSLAEAVADSKLVVGTTAVGHRDLHVPLYRLETAAPLIREQLGSPVSLLFGSEKFGLSNEHLSHCHWLVRIPTRDEHGSMNLGQAAAICLYELRRDPEAVNRRFSPADMARADETERFTVLLYEALLKCGYLQPATARSSQLKLRRLVRRLGMPAADVETWLGIARQILWALKREAK
jgi:TrmH family RNA methyltransferase